MHAVIVKFENWKMAFRKFGKFEEQSSKFWNIRKIGREQMNEAEKNMSKLQKKLITQGKNLLSVGCAQP